MAILRRYQYSCRSFEIAEVDGAQWAPGASTGAGRISAPGAGLFEVSDLHLSDKKVTRAEKLTFSAQLAGRNFAYVFADLWLFDPGNDLAYGPIWRRYVKAPSQRLVGGVKAPKWQPEQRLSVTFSPAWHALDDGQQIALGRLLPERYGVPLRTALYLVQGALRSPDEGTARRAILYFSSNGRLQQTQVQARPGPAGGYRPVTLAEGDLFTPFVGLLRRSGESWQEEIAQSNTLVAGGRELHSSTYALFPGKYLAGFTIQDMDDRLHYYLTGLEVYEG
jgi:hypothetical protein